MSTATKQSPSPADLGVQVGDFFVSSWGYDQTNVDFYKVVEVLPKSVRVQHWTSKTVDDNGPVTHVVPGDKPKTVTDWSACTPEMGYWERQEAKVESDAPFELKRLRSYGQGESQRVYFTVNSFSSASKWDGRPAYQTGSGFGH